jgi:outer membrane protein assembly factor BamA
MNHTVVAIALILSSVAASTACGQPGLKKPVEYVGQVIIVGNTVTKDRVIRGQLEFYPGQVLDRSELIAAEKKLIQLGLFKCDPANKIVPTVRVLECEGPLKDIVVRVEEASNRTFLVEGNTNSMGRPIVRLMLEDRNFDLFGFPVSVADILKDRAFRGGGQKVRFELVRLTVLDLRIEFFSDGKLLPIAVKAFFE